MIENFKYDIESKKYLEKIYIDMRKQVEILEKNWRKIPNKARNILNRQFNENYAPEFCFRWLKQDLDELYRNSDEFFDYIKEEIGEEIKIMNQYESIFIIKPNKNQEEIKEIIGKYQKMIEKFSNKKIEVEDIGEKKLAYEIQNNKTGHYVLFKFSSQPENITELERNYRIDDDVMKFIVVKMEEQEYDETEEEETEED